MPSIEKHIELSLKRTGKEYREIHEWMDRGISYRERIARHRITNAQKFLPIIEEEFGKDAIKEYLKHIEDDYENNIIHCIKKMLKKITQVKLVIKQVVRGNYFVLAFCLSILMFILLYFLTLATTTNHSLSIFIMMNGIGYAISTFFLLFIISLLFGIYVSLFAYKIRMNIKGNKAISISGGSGGFITGLFGAGCPMCGSAMFALFGAPLALFFMPFKGLELKVLSIMILSLSVYLVSESISSCKIKN